MAAVYPNALKSFTNPLTTDNLNNPSHAQQHIDENDEIVAIETELGISPKGAYATVKARLDAMQALFLLAAHPIGSIYESYVSTNPGTIFGGTWVTLGAGQVAVGISTAGTFNVVAGTTGGVESVTLTAAESGLRSHGHSFQYGMGAAGGTAYIGSPYGPQSVIQATVPSSVVANASSSATQSHTNLQPYVAVYRWRRTA
jgi:hypothetical protein